MNKISIILGILLVMAIGVAGYFWFQTQQNPGQALGPYTPAVTESPIPDVKPQDETENWKTLTFTRYNFSMKLPPNWEVSNNAMTGAPIELLDNNTIIDGYGNLIYLKKDSDPKILLSFDMSQGIPGGIFRHSEDPEIDQILATFKFDSN